MDMLNKRIKERRTELGMTLMELAQKVGVRDATIQRYESGEIKNIKRTMVIKLALALECTPQYLMGWAEEPPRTLTMSEVRKVFEDTLINEGIIKRGGDLTEEQFKISMNLLRAYFDSVNNDSNGTK